MFNWQYFRDADPLPSAPGNIETGGVGGMRAQADLCLNLSCFDFHWQHKSDPLQQKGLGMLARETYHGLPYSLCPPCKALRKWVG